MKKLILQFFSSLLVFSLVVFLLALFLQFEITINIKPSSKSVVQAKEPDDSEAEELGCFILANYDLSEIDEEISKLYLRGYRLKDFSVVPTPQSTIPTPASIVITGYAAVCKD